MLIVGKTGPGCGLDLGSVPPPAKPRRLGQLLAAKLFAESGSLTLSRQSSTPNLVKWEGSVLSDLSKKLKSPADLESHFRGRAYQSPPPKNVMRSISIAIALLFSALLAVDARVPGTPSRIQPRADAAADGRVVGGVPLKGVQRYPFFGFALSTKYPDRLVHGSLIGPRTVLTAGKQ